MVLAGLHELAFGDPRQRPLKVNGALSYMPHEDSGMLSALLLFTRARDASKFHTHFLRNIIDCSILLAPYCSDFWDWEILQ